MSGFLWRVPSGCLIHQNDVARVSAFPDRGSPSPFHGLGLLKPAPSLLMIVTCSMAAAVSLPFSVLTRGTHPHAAGRQLDQTSKSGTWHSVIRRTQSPTSSGFFVVPF